MVQVALTWLALLAASAHRSTACIVSGDRHVVLGETDTAGLVKELPRFFEDCSLDSVAEPQVFSGLDPLQEWVRVASAGHVYFSLDNAVSVGRSPGEVRVSEALIPLEVTAPYWFTRHKGRVVIWTKCAWPAARRIMCHAAVLPHLSATGRTWCEELR